MNSSFWTALLAGGNPVLAGGDKNMFLALKECRLHHPVFACVIVMPPALMQRILISLLILPPSLPPTPCPSSPCSFLLAVTKTSHDNTHFMLNFLALAICIVPKMNVMREVSCIIPPCSPLALTPYPHLCISFYSFLFFSFGNDDKTMNSSFWTALLAGGNPVLAGGDKNMFLANLDSNLPTWSLYMPPHYAVPVQCIGVCFLTSLFQMLTTFSVCISYSPFSFFSPLVSFLTQILATKTF